MAMQVGGDGGEESPINDINTTPLVDVMLVLLIIFLITVPVVLHTPQLNLPKVDFRSTETKPQNVNLSVLSRDGQNCEVYWDMERVSADRLFEKGKERYDAELKRLGGVINDIEDLAEVHIRGDKDVPYRCVGGAIFKMQQVGFLKVGFISSPTNPAAR
jgi:biopolymer transport protein ExbD